VAVEVYAGNTSDPKTVSDQVTKLRQRFGLQRVILVGDRRHRKRVREDCCSHTPQKAPASGKQNIGLRAGKVLNRYKMGKHFQVQIEDDSFTYTRKQANIEKEESLDGIYVIRTNVPPKRCPASKLSQFTRACRVWSAPFAA